MAFFGKTEIFMVNEMGLPFNSGTLFVSLLLVAFFYFGLRYTKQKGLVFYNTIILCTLFILIGFSTWMMLPIRANANTVINENKPSDAAEVLAYYNREQYGVNPLFYGPQYSDTFAGLDKETPYLDKAPNYERDYKTGKYIITNNYKNAEQNSDDNQKAILPRLWSTEHVENYMDFTHPLEFRMNPNYAYEDDLGQYGIDIDKLSEEDLKTWSNFMINRFLSMKPEWVELIASILPLTQTLSPKEMYSLYINVIPKGKYFLKYIKGKSEDKYEQFIVDLLKKEYDCSENQAIDYLEVLYSTREGREYLKYVCEKYGIDKKQITKLKLKI